MIVLLLNLKGDLFEPGTFDGIPQNATTLIYFYRSGIDYFPESSFKPFLNNKKNKIYSIKNNEKILTDCSDCRNLWLVNENKENQVQNVFCKDDLKKRLFDNEVKNKYKSKCKSINLNLKR